MFEELHRGSEEPRTPGAFGDANGFDEAALIAAGIEFIEDRGVVLAEKEEE